MDGRLRKTHEAIANKLTGGAWEVGVKGKRGEKKKAKRKREWCVKGDFELDLYMRSPMPLPGRLHRWNVRWRRRWLPLRLRW
jgi:hypothetical protein